MSILHGVPIASVTLDGERVPLYPDAELLRGGLRVTVQCERMHPQALSWTVRLENIGKADSPRVTKLLGLDVTIPCASDAPSAWHGLRGDSNDGRSFLPDDVPLTPGVSFHREPTGGRSSNTTAFPYFDVTAGDAGYTVALGWSGQWFLDAARGDDGVTLRAGQVDCDYTLHPGETARSVRVLLWEGSADLDRLRDGFRALHREHYSPRTVLGRDFPAPITVQCFDRYFWGAKPASDGSAPYFETEDAQIRIVEAVGRCRHFDTHWIDACWFRDTFRSGVGNYGMSTGFPNGLKKISDAAHRNGMKLIVWFEPVRAMPGTDVWNAFEDDPEALIRLPERNYACCNFGNPAMWQWTFEHIVQTMEENGIDWFREDFNLDPLPFLRTLDTPGRVGLTEMRFVEGLYKLWDSLRARFPGLFIDNCASGGRLLDLETCSRAWSLWQSDTGCSPHTPTRPVSVWHQNQNLTLSRYLPFHQTSSFEKDAYTMRSAMTAGISCEYDFLSDDFDTEAAAAAVGEVKRLAWYWEGSFRALTEPSLADDVWSGYRLEREGKLCAVLLRRPQAPGTFTINLGADPARVYRVTAIDDDRRESVRTMTGAELNTFAVTVPQAPGSVVILCE